MLSALVTKKNLVNFFVPLVVINIHVQFIVKQIPLLIHVTTFVILFNFFFADAF